MILTLCLLLYGVYKYIELMLIIMMDSGSSCRIWQL